MGAALAIEERPQSPCLDQNLRLSEHICFMSSPDGINWSEWQRLGQIDEGHYQVSAVGPGKAGSASNFHPKGKGLNWRSNLYYLETTDNGPPDDVWVLPREMDAESQRPKRYEAQLSQAGADKPASK